MLQIKIYSKKKIDMEIKELEPEPEEKRIGEEASLMIEEMHINTDSILDKVFIECYIYCVFY